MGRNIEVQIQALTSLSRTIKFMDKMFIAVIKQVLAVLKEN